MEAARAEVDLSGVTAIGIDETSKKGTEYVTVFADLDSGSVINVQDGKDSSWIFQNPVRSPPEPWFRRANIF